MMITANPTRSQLWIEPTGKVHEFDDVTHGKWAMDKLGMAYHPELEEDADGFTKEIPEGWMDTFEVEQEAQSQLLKAGWIRMGFFRRGHAAVVYVQKDSPLTPAELGRAQTWIMQHPEWQGPAIDVQDPKLWTVPMADFLAAKKTTEFRGLKTAAGPIPLDTKLIDRVFRAIVSNIKGYWGNYDAPIGERELQIAFSLSATPTNVNGEERQGLNVKLVFEDAYLSKAVRGAEVYPGKWPTLVVYLSGKLTGQDITKRLEGLEGFYLRGILVHELAHVFDHIPDEALGVSPKDNAEAYYNLDTEVSAYATQLWHYIVTNADYYREGGADWLRKTGEKGLWSLVDSALTLRIGNGIRRYCNEANRRYILQVAYRAMQEVLESPESKAASLKIAEDAGITKADLQRIRPILREWVGGGWTDGPQLMRLLEKHKDILAKFRMSKPVRLWRNERAQLLTRGGQDVTGPSNAGWEDQYTRPSAWSATRMHAESYASGNGRRLVTAIVPPEDTYCYIPLVEQAARALGMKTFDPHQQDEVIVRPNPSFLDQIRPKVTGGEEAQLRRDYELAMVEYHLPQLHELRKTNPKAISDEELKRRIADIAKHKEIHDVRDELAKLQRGKAARKNASIIEPHFNEKLALSRTFYRVATVSRVRYETALETLYPALNLWVFYGKRGDKEQLLSAYAGLPPQLRAAWDAEVHRTFLNTFGPSVKVYRRLKDTGPAEPGSSYTTDPQDTPGGVDSKVVGPDEVLAHWGQQGTPLASKAFGHEHEIILKPHAVVTASQVRHYQPKRLSPSDVLVTLDVAKVDASWRRDKTFYIEPGGGNQLRGRYDRFAQWLQDNQGTPIDPLDIGLTPSGEIIFGNGRHRFAVLRDQGAKRIAATVPKQDFKTMAERFGAQPVQGTSVTASGSVQTLVGRAKQLTKQDPLYEALGPYECGAFDGGCLICAEALISAAGRGDLVRLVDVKGRTHHYGARIDGLYCDFSGAYPSGDMWAKTFARLEHVREALHAEEGLDPNYQEEETPRDPQCSREIAQLLLGSKTAKTFDQLYPATPEWVGAAKAFFLKKWQERAQERGMSLPVDVSNACKFGSRFAQKLFGGTLRGNWHHQFVQLPDGQRVDLGEDAMDRQTHGDDASWYAHDKTFWGNREHRESMASVEPRVTAWVTEFQKEHPVSRIAKTLYHGTSTERAQRIQREGLEPQVGDLTATAYEDDAESVGEELEPLTFAGDKDALQRGVYSAMLHAIQAEGHDITDAEQAIRNWGALVILRDGDEVMDYRHPDDGVTNPTEHPMQVEPEDYYSRDNVAIDYILTGPTLVRYLKRHGVNMERWTRPFSEQKRNALVGMVRRAHPDVPVDKIVEKVNTLTFEQFHKSWDYYTKLERSQVAKLASKNQVPAEGENVTPWDLAHIAVAQDDELADAIIEYVQSNFEWSKRPDLRDRLLKLIQKCPPFSRTLYRAEEPYEGGSPENGQRGFRSWTLAHDTAVYLGNHMVGRDFVVRTTGGAPVKALSIDDFHYWHGRIHGYAGSGTAQAEFLVLDSSVPKRVWKTDVRWQKMASNNEDATGQCHCTVCGTEIAEGMVCTECAKTCRVCGGPTRNCKCASFVHAKDALCHDCWGKTKTATLTKEDIQGRRRALEAFFPAELVQDAIDEAPDTYTMPKDEAVEEHERLIEVLRSPDHADDLREADEQEGELQKIKTASAFYSDQMNAMSPDAHKAWARIRQRHPVTFEPGEGGYDSTGRHRIELKTAATQNRVWVLPTSKAASTKLLYWGGRPGATHLVPKNTEHRAGIWLTDSIKVAASFGTEIYRVEVTGLNNPLVVDAQGEFYSEIPTPQILKDEGVTFRDTCTTDNIVAYALTKGYDSVIIQNVTEGFSAGGVGLSHQTGTDYVLLKEGQARIVSSFDYKSTLDVWGMPKDPKLASAPPVGVNINDSEHPWTQMILQGKKTIETRDSDSLRPHVGERVGIVRTGGRGPAALVGYCTLGEPKVYRTNAEFRADNASHRIPDGPQWDLQPGAVKFGYPLADVEACEPKRVEGQGRVFRRIAAPLGDAAWQHILSRFPKEFQAEVLAERSGKSLEDIQELQNWRLTSRAPVVIPLNAAFIQQQCEAMHLPAEVVQRINEMWGLGLRPSGQVYDPNPERYFRYAQMPAATANPSIMLGPDIVWGVGRFVAACLRGDRSLRVWKLRQGKSASFLTKDDIKARAREIEQRTGKSSRQLLEEMYARQDEHFPGFVKEASVFYHGGGTEKLPPSAAGILWLTDDVHAAASHAMKYLHHGTPSLWKVTLKDDAKLVALWDLSDPIVRKVKEEVSEERRMTHGRGVSDEEWVRHAADFGALEAFPWMLKQLRAAGVDGVWVHEQHAGRKRLSLGLINGDAQTSQEPQALHPDVEHAHA